MKDMIPLLCMVVCTSLDWGLWIPLVPTWNFEALSYKHKQNTMHRCSFMEVVDKLRYHEEVWGSLGRFLFYTYFSV